jgi:hypothetical protein
MQRFSLGLWSNMTHASSPGVMASSCANLYKVQVELETKPCLFQIIISLDYIIQ